MKRFLLTAANAERRTPNAEHRIQTRTFLRSTFDVRRSAFGVFIRLGVVFLLAGCTNMTPPVVTPEMAVGKNPDRTVAMAELQHGRILFASRCIECHTLPPVNAHDATEWPCLVGWMAKRASLKSEEREAMIAYLVAARAQNTDSK